MMTDTRNSIRGYLRGQRLLNLEPFGVHVQDARQLADPHNPAVGEISDVRLPEDGHHVVLAVALEADVAEEDDPS